ncbi:MAG TPA: TetR family transcriptional regulator [Solirubrobacteraceae bacterium]|nr:TetR family transcriptional regulator [Solirubrobacteraceae bacterium]
MAQSTHSSEASARAPYPVAARELLRNSLMDAARDLIAERPFAEVTMAQIAEQAGVSRQTLYNEFGSREEFTQALLLREADRFLTSVEQAVSAHSDDPAKALEAAFEVFLIAAAEDPIVRAGLRDGAEELLALVTTRGRPIVEYAVQRLAGVIATEWPEAARPDCELLSESLVRLAISYAALPKGPTLMTAESVAQLLGPFIEQALAREGGKADA